MLASSLPPSITVPSSIDTWKGVNKSSPKRISPVTNSSPYRLPASREHYSHDAASVKGSVSISSALSSQEIRQQFIEKYALGPILGRGASAEVFQARLRISTESSVFPFAVKIIRRDNRMNDSTTMATELEILRRVQHENVIQLVEVFETKDTLFLVMERAQGGDLLSALASIPEYTEVAVREVFRQLLEAVQYLHSLGIVHRDLKLDNLLFDSSSSPVAAIDENDDTDDESTTSHHEVTSSSDQINIKVKVADFGLSALLQDEKKTSSFVSLLSSPEMQAKRDSQLKDLWGTTEYFAPEVYDRRYGRQADVWALGCILFEMLTGELAFPYRETKIGLVERILFHGGRKPSRVFERKETWKKLSPEARSLIKSMLKSSPTKRLSISECLEHSWFKTNNNIKGRRPVLKHISSEDSCSTCSTASSLSTEESSIVLSEAQRVLKERVSRRARRYANLVAEIATRK